MWWYFSVTFVLGAYRATAPLRALAERAVSLLGQTALLFAPSGVWAREESPNQPRRGSKGLGASIQVELILMLRF